MDDRGGENVSMDVGLGLGLLLHGACSDLPRGVVDPVPLKSEGLGLELYPLFSRGMSREILPSVRLWSSGMPSRSGAPTGCCRGLAGADCLFELSMFSKWLRSEDTGFYRQH